MHDSLKVLLFMFVGMLPTICQSQHKNTKVLTPPYFDDAIRLQANGIDLVVPQDGTSWDNRSDPCVVD